MKCASRHSPHLDVAEGTHHTGAQNSVATCSGTHWKPSKSKSSSQCYSNFDRTCSGTHLKPSKSNSSLGLFEFILLLNSSSSQNNVSFAEVGLGTSPSQQSKLISQTWPPYLGCPYAAGGLWGVARLYWRIGHYGLDCPYVAAGQ